MYRLYSLQNYNIEIQKINIIEKIEILNYRIS